MEPGDRVQPGGDGAGTEAAREAGSEAGSEAGNEAGGEVGGDLKQGSPPAPRSGAHAKSGSFRDHLVTRSTQLAAIALIVAGLLIAGSIAMFYVHSHDQGAALVHRVESLVHQAQSNPAICSNHSTTTTSTVPLGAGSSALPSPAVGSGSLPAGGTSGLAPAGILEIPSIALKAPIIQGESNAQLAVAVGHDPLSTWPNTTGGTVVLAAHDVTWFSHIDQLRPGDTVSVVEPCVTYVYRVTTGQVVSAGTPVISTAQPRLVLVTCYPLDALFLTSKRYVVDAYLEQIRPTGTKPPAIPPWAPPSVSAPAALLAQGLTLNENPAPEGNLILQGSVSPAWQQSPAPLEDDYALLELYFGALKSAEQNQPLWWAQLAPGVPFSNAVSLVGSRVAGYGAQLSPVLTLNGERLTSVELTTYPTVVGGLRPGPMQIQMTAAVRNGQLVITGWSVQSVK
ncbi:MAG: class D sortase [Acidimicrobiales bacterium]